MLLDVTKHVYHVRSNIGWKYGIEVFYLPPPPPPPPPPQTWYILIY